MFIAEIITAFLLDRMIGHPENRYHPVRGIGWLISYFENKLRLGRPGERSNFVRGGFMVILVLACVGGATILLLRVADLLVPEDYFIFTGPIGVVDPHKVIVFSFSTLIIYFSLSLKDLGGLARECGRLTDSGRLAEARLKLKGLVGRDTSELTGAEIKKAAIESVAENLTDSFVAPVFYAALFGPLGAILYRTVNTIDSMCGYKNEKFMEFGFAGAKLDDLLNFIPARICGFVLILTGAFYKRGLATMRALRIVAGQAKAGQVGGNLGPGGYDYDSRLSCNLADVSQVFGNHPSPNAWVPEVAFAEILSIRLGGNAIYGGKLVLRPEMGPADAETVELSVNKAVGLLWSAAYVYMTLHLLVALAVIL